MTSWVILNNLIIFYKLLTCNAILFVIRDEGNVIKYKCFNIEILRNKINMKTENILCQRGILAWRETMLEKCVVICVTFVGAHFFLMTDTTDTVSSLSSMTFPFSSHNFRKSERLFLFLSCYKIWFFFLYQGSENSTLVSNAKERLKWKICPFLITFFWTLSSFSVNTPMYVRILKQDTNDTATKKFTQYLH